MNLQHRLLTALLFLVHFASCAPSNGASDHRSGGGSGGSGGSGPDFGFPTIGGGHGGERPAPDFCDQFTFPEGGPCYACLSTRCCEPMMQAAPWTERTEFDGGTPNYNMVWRYTYEGPFRCVQECFAKERTNASDPMQVAWGCAQTCTADYVPQPHEDEATNEQSREGVRALIGCSVGATPTRADGGLPENCTAECFPSW